MAGASPAMLITSCSMQQNETHPFATGLFGVPEKLEKRAISC
jgi:hypothetical protein